MNTAESLTAPITPRLTFPETDTAPERPAFVTSIAVAAANREENMGGIERWMLTLVLNGDIEIHAWEGDGWEYLLTDPNTQRPVPVPFNDLLVPLGVDADPDGEAEDVLSDYLDQICRGFTYTFEYAIAEANRVAIDATISDMNASFNA